MTMSLRIPLIAALALVTAPVLVSTAGCGGSMASSSFGWGLTSFTTPDRSQVNETITMEARYFAEIPNVNPLRFDSGSPQSVGTFSSEWSEVLPSENATPRVQMNKTGTIGTSLASDTSPNVRLSGVSGNSLTVSTPGPVTIRLRVTLNASDGSSRRKDFFTTLNIVGPAGD